VNFRKLLFSIILICATLVSKAQTVGDLTIISANVNKPDIIKVLATTTIYPNTTFFITDNAWDGTSALSTSEGYINWKSPGTPLAPGTVITFSTTSTGVWTFGNSTVTEGTITSTSGFGMSVSGDNVFIIKGTNTSTPSLSDFIWGYSTRSWITSSSTNANTSYLPSTLISYSTTHSSASVNDGYFANGSSSTTSLTISNTDKCAIINLIINPAKWYTSTSSTALSPPDYNIGFATTISYASSTYCKSGSASVTLTGTSGGIYSGSSGLSINSSGTIDLAASIADSVNEYFKN
jgi:hypothetical protein